MGAMDAGMGGGAKEGLRAYYTAKIEEHELAVRSKTQNLARLQAQRNELNAKGALYAAGRSSWGVCA